MTPAPAPGPHLALVGPTASGKSALALEVARRLPDVELVSVDSMQVYRGMDVGTAKPTPAERAEVPVHLVDIADPSEDFSVVEFQAAALSVLGDVEARGHRALLVGGTGLYLRAVVEGLSVPPQWPAVRAELEAEPDTAALHRRLAGLDPVAAARMTPTNRRRVVRALEVVVGSGRPFSSFGVGLDVHPPVPFLLAGVWLPREVVGERIARRFAAMVGAGLVGEVAALAARPRGLSRTASQALGYREVLAHLRGECSLDEAVDEAVRRTRRFARRQRVWFRRDPRVTWYGCEENPVALTGALLGDWGRR
ncbi:MAG TPA: tRNA (adenosine(37)-N6)-dimethylallyltransferase MiaA [Acidimicrobiales bacterium]|nr:tRNA (adenosine(37)-N6)-dimethylallyltransferase MiaA [Acidimicrobiales bacterium]